MWIQRQGREDLELVKVSPSKMSVASNCPRCYWLTGRGIRRPRGIFPSMPGGFDRCLKSLAAAGRRRRRLPRLLNEKLPGRTLYGEEPRRLTWYCEPLHAQLTGIPDEWCLEPNGEISIIDFKTKGTSPNGSFHPSYRTQLDIYALLVERIAGFPRLSGKAYLIYFFPETSGNEGLDVISEVIEVPVDTGTALSKFQLAVNMLRGEALPPSLDCEYCLREARIIGMSRATSELGLSDDFIRQASERFDMSPE